jgi:hypothetical protein
LVWFYAGCLCFEAAAYCGLTVDILLADAKLNQVLIQGLVVFFTGSSFVDFSSSPGLFGLWFG